MGMIVTSSKGRSGRRYQFLKTASTHAARLYGGGNMDTLALILSIIGSLNWGLVGIFQFDLVAWIFGGQDAVFSRIIYAIIGLAGLWCISLLFRRRRIGIVDDE